MVEGEIFRSLEGGKESLHKLSRTSVQSEETRKQHETEELRYLALNGIMAYSSNKAMK